MNLNKVWVQIPTDKVKRSMAYMDTDSSRQGLLTELIRIGLTEETPAIRLSILRQVALIINKFLRPEDIHLATDILLLKSSEFVKVESSSEIAIPMTFWIAKALILRLVNTTEVLDHLLSLLSKPACSLLSARGFSLLLAPDEILSKENGAIIRLLATQRVFSVCAPHIVQDFRSAESSLKPNYLIALSGILKYTPTDVLLPEIETLLPLLLQTLDLQDADVQAATIENLTVVSQKNPKAVEGHASSLISRLLKAAVETKRNVPVCILYIARS